MRLARYVALQCALIAIVLGNGGSASAATPSASWIVQSQRSGWDSATDVLSDGVGNVYVSGAQVMTAYRWASATTTFLAKYDSQGTELWKQSVGPFSWGAQIATDGAGAIYQAGTFLSDGTNWDARIIKYDGAGAVLWNRAFATPFTDSGWGAGADAHGNVFLTGAAAHPHDGPYPWPNDAFVAKYDAAGDLQWSRTLDSGKEDGSKAAAVDPQGNVLVTGDTTGSLVRKNLGEGYGTNDAFVAKYDTNGVLLWTQQFGDVYQQWSRAVATDGAGNVDVAGVTDTNKSGPYRVDPTGPYVYTGLTYDGFVNQIQPAGESAVESVDHRPLPRRADRRLGRRSRRRLLHGQLV